MTDAARIFNNIKAEYFDVQQRIFFANHPRYAIKLRVWVMNLVRKLLKFSV